MIRQNLSAGSAHAMMVMTPGNGANFQWRPTTGGSMSFSQITGVSAPYWVRLVRLGNSFSAYMSADGNTWRQVGTTQTISMANVVYAGLAVTAHNSSSICSATFDNVTATGWPPPAVLTISLSGANVTLSWPGGASGFNVIGRTNLNLGNWLQITSPVSQLIGDQWQLTVPSSGNAQFFRLQR